MDMPNKTVGAPWEAGVGGAEPASVNMNTISGLVCCVDGYADDAYVLPLWARGERTSSTLPLLAHNE